MNESHLILLLLLTPHLILLTAVFLYKRFPLLLVKLLSLLSISANAFLYSLALLYLLKLSDLLNLLQHFRVQTNSGCNLLLGLGVVWQQ